MSDNHAIQTVLVTGAAGFIGSYVCESLLQQGKSVIAIDNLNDYYPVALKKARLTRLSDRPGFTFHALDIADHQRLAAIENIQGIDAIIHLAAQAGVRYSLENPFAYATSNLTGHLSVLELARHAPNLQRMVYASSSSVYGANQKVPFSESDPVTAPVSLYAATKRADEMMSESYARLYDLSLIGLRFFTVYGPWGRPDMAYWSFAQNILDRKPIKVFNSGDMQRDFTYIDDIVDGVLKTALMPAKPKGESRHQLYNIGNNQPVKLMHFIEVLEDALGQKAEKQFAPMQPGDVPSTYADIDAIGRDYGFAPTTSLEAGIPKFVEWFKAYRANSLK